MKYTVIAYAEGGLPRKETIITARNKVSLVEGMENVPRIPRGGSI